MIDKPRIELEEVTSSHFESLCVDSSYFEVLQVTLSHFQSLLIIYNHFDLSYIVKMVISYKTFSVAQ